MKKLILLGLVLASAPAHADTVGCSAYNGNWENAPTNSCIADQVVASAPAISSSGYTVPTPPPPKQPKPKV